jgi:integrase
VLTDIKIRNTKPSHKAVKLTDAGGLYLEVSPRGSKLWRYRYRIGGKENLFALGAYARAPEGETDQDKFARIGHGKLTLHEARTERDKCRGMVKQGIHPAHNRQALLTAKVADNANTFEAVAKEWVQQNKSNWDLKYLKQIEHVLKTDVYPRIGSTPCRAVTAAQIFDILKRVHNRGATTVAILIRQWVSAIFRYAVATLRADTDPASALRGAIKRVKVKHCRALATADISVLLDAIGNYGGHRSTTIALRLLLLTFVRTAELRSAEWSEIDFEAAEWRIPEGRMKMREHHIVPLSHQALALLRQLYELTGKQTLLFPNTRNPNISMTATTLNRALERMGYRGSFSAHGFRSNRETIGSCGPKSSACKL